MEMNRWDLSILYNGFDDPKYSEDVKLLEGAVNELSVFADKAESIGERELLLGYIEISEKISRVVSDLMIFANLSYSQNTADTSAASAIGKVMDILSATSAPDARLKARIAAISDLSKIIDSDSELSEYSYFFNSICRASKYMLSDVEEELFSKMNISGASAWSDLQSALTSSVKVSYEGENITLPSARNLAYSPDPAVRKNGYLAELECYTGIRDAVAFALNSIKLQVINECRTRGYESPLDKALSDSRMKKETLDALIGAMEEYMPVFRKYLKAKAKALGYEGGLKWYDLFAPMGSSDKTYTVEDAREYLLNIFRDVDGDIYALVDEAFRDGWIDFYPREGKVGGAFDCGVPSKGVSRVLTNFDGSLSDIVTLAHELGHSFHDRQVFKNSLLNQEYTMPVAETASTFNEVLVMERAIETAGSDEEKLLLIESQLQDATQIIVDIYSRFRFESEVFDRRSEQFLGADELSDIMLSAQEAAYGDGLAEDERHPYMWVCKGHYYSGGLSFYNFPYAFGGLFARGLYARYKHDGAEFMKTYKKMLTYTSVADVEDAARVAGIDLTSRDFWREGLETIAKKIEQFCEIVK